MLISFLGDFFLLFFSPTFLLWKNLLVWCLCHANKVVGLCHFKYDPEVECCIEAYFFSSIVSWGGDYMFEVLVLITVLNLQAFVSIVR